VLLSYAPATELCRFSDPRITESSGVSASAHSDHVILTHNDSGEGARVYAVDTRTGTTIGVLEVADARADDWEDMARGLTADRRPALFLADIGDNLRRRPAVAVYEIVEAAVPIGDVRPVARHELRYDDGSHDAETLLVDPASRDLLVVTKDPEGLSGVYRAGPDEGTLRRVAEIRFDTLARRRGPYAKAATGGDVSPDGRRVVIRTPYEAFEWDVGDGGLVAAFAGTPRRFDLPAVVQGEAIAYTRDGRSLVVTSEGSNAPVHLLRGDHDVGPDLLVPEPPRPRPARTRWRWWYLAGSLPAALMFVRRVRRGRRRRRRPPPGTGAPGA
jgi:hypothetical protein